MFKIITALFLTLAIGAKCATLPDTDQTKPDERCFGGFGGGFPGGFGGLGGFGGGFPGFFGKRDVETKAKEVVAESEEPCDKQVAEPEGEITEDVKPEEKCFGGFGGFPGGFGGGLGGFGGGFPGFFGKRDVETEIKEVVAEPEVEMAAEVQDLGEPVAVEAETKAEVKPDAKCFGGFGGGFGGFPGGFGGGFPGAFGGGFPIGFGK